MSYFMLSSVFTIILCFLCFFVTKAELVSYFCQNQTSYTANSPFQTNLKSLTSSLSSPNAPYDAGFYNTTTGQIPDRVFGIFFCRGDISGRICRDCVVSATNDSLTLCPFDREVIIWYDLCMVRYANRNIFSKMEADPIYTIYDNKSIESNRLDQFSEFYFSKMKNLSDSASSAPAGSRKFSTGKDNFTAVQTVYSLVECTPDLTAAECSSCLDQAINLVLISKVGARFGAQSCNLRYEFYPFYNETSTTTVTPLSDPSQGEEEPTYLFTNCSNTTNFTINSDYHTNLKTLLSTLSSSDSSYGSGFLNATAGNPPDRAYGLYLCRGDVSAQICQDCVAFAAKDILTRCPVQKEAVIWYDQCMFRHSYKNIFSNMETTPFFRLRSGTNVSSNELVRFDDLVMSVMREAASNALVSVKKYATQRGNLTRFRAIYSLVQCTPDLSKQDCESCLLHAINLTRACCVVYIGARTVNPSCNVRFEVYPFYDENGTFTKQLPSPLGLTTQTSKGRGKSSCARVWGIVVPVVACVVLLVIGSCILARRAKKKGYALQENVVKK